MRPAAADLRTENGRWYKSKKEDERVMKRKMAKLAAALTMTAMVMGTCHRFNMCAITET